MRINKIYILSLDPENSEADIVERLGQCQFYENTPYEIIQGYDGRDGSVPENYNIYDGWNLGDSTWNDWWKRPVLGGEVGCAAGHREIWEKIVFDSLGLSLVLEDDFLMNGNGSIAALPDPNDMDWNVALLGRDKIEKDVEEEYVDEHWVRPRHFYNMHAYVIRNSMTAKQLLSGGLKENVIPVDEYLSALGYPHRRDDIRKMFPPSLKIVATKDSQFMVQNRNSFDSNIEPGADSPNLTGQNAPKQNVGQHGQPGGEPDPAWFKEADEIYYEILDTSDWEAWKEKYINLSVSKHEFELMVTDRGDNVFEFPLFTPKFCKEAIALAEAKDKWTIDRHEFYPTNDVLLEEIGLDDIYNRVLDEVVRPLAIHLWNLEGKSWDGFSNENFMARYSTTRQSHLSLHHDRSHLTMVIKLNDEFSGGGTWFPQYQKLSNPEQVGTAVLHPGMITHRHGARPITNGKRYIIVSFIRSHLEP